MILLMAAAAAAGGDADAAIGRWKTENRNAIVEIAHCGASICGRLVSSDGIRTNPDLRDINNKDATLKGRRLAGIQLIGGFRREARGWGGGTIYNPEDGGTYKATLTAEGPDRLKLKGCIVWPLCKTQTWTRIR